MTQDVRPGRTRPSPATLIAFAAVAVIGGSNAVAIRLGNVELAPFWGAALRFLPAGFILLGLAALRRLHLPRGRALVGAILFGLLDFGLGYAFLYWALQEVHAGTAQSVLALVPLATFLLAVVQRLEPFRVTGVIGAVIAAAGVVWMFAGSAEAIPIVALLSLLATTLCFAEAVVIIKLFPLVDPVAENAIAMTVGGGLLLAISLLTGEPKALPVELQTWASLIYLILFGSIAMFLLILFVIQRWTASASSYSLLLMPLMTFALGVVLLDEPVTGALLGGAALVVVGVYFGVFIRPRRVPPGV